MCEHTIIWYYSIDSRTKRQTLVVKIFVVGKTAAIISNTCAGWCYTLKQTDRSTNERLDVIVASDEPHECEHALNT